MLHFIIIVIKLQFGGASYMTIGGVCTLCDKKNNLEHWSTSYMLATGSTEIGRLWLIFKVACEQGGTVSFASFGSCINPVELRLSIESMELFFRPMMCFLLPLILFFILFSFLVVLKPYLSACYSWNSLDPLLPQNLCLCPFPLFSSNLHVQDLLPIFRFLMNVMRKDISA